MENQTPFWEDDEAQYLEKSYDEEQEYRERVLDSLMNAVLEARSFLPAKEVLKIVIDAL